MSVRLSFSDLSFIPKRIFVGFSSGLDSRVLFDLLYHDAFVKEHGVELILVHVNHHAQALADRLSEFAQQVAKSYQVPFRLLDVQAQCPPGESLEAFLREERYHLFDSLLEEKDVLALAHHADDQAETFLLNLMRGSGLQGLSAMAAMRQQGRGLLWRPLLTYLRKDLEVYAREKNLEWIEDPMNQDLQFDRVFLRREILPQLNSRWLRATELLCRASNHIRSAQEVLGFYLHRDLQSLVGADDSLDLKKLKAYPQTQGLLLLKTYLDDKNYRLSTVQLQQIYRDFVLSDSDAHPLFEYQGVKLQRIKWRLYFSKENPI